LTQESHFTLNVIADACTPEKRDRTLNQPLHFDSGRDLRTGAGYSRKNMVTCHLLRQTRTETGDGAAREEEVSQYAA
jgi:hypothetical protein